jgi:hypothetical protein
VVVEEVEANHNNNNNNVANSIQTAGSSLVIIPGDLIITVVLVDMVEE